MNELQLSEIRNYLLDKKLPIDILIEVQDHFVSQINDLQRDENLNFEEAFQKTKTSWDKELKPYWKGGLSLEDVSDFMRRMRKQNEVSNLTWSLKWSWIPIAVIFGSAFFLRDVAFGIFSLFVLGSCIGVAFYIYFTNIKSFRLAKKYENNVLTLHQHSVFIFFIIISPMINVLNQFLQEPAKYKSIFMLKRDISELLFLIFTVLIVIFAVFYSISAQKNYLTQIEKIKPFLKYLKPSS